MSDRVLLALTVEGEDLIKKRGWSGYYPVNQDRAKDYEYIAFCSNRYKSEAMKGDWDFATATKPHGTGFMLARIADIVPANQLDSHPNVADRWIFTLREFAGIDLPNLWQGWRYPVNYEHTLQGLGLDPATLQFQPMPPPRSVEAPDTNRLRRCVNELLAAARAATPEDLARLQAYL